MKNCGAIELWEHFTGHFIRRPTLFLRVIQYLCEQTLFGTEVVEGIEINFMSNIFIFTDLGMIKQRCIVNFRMHPPCHLKSKKSLLAWKLDSFIILQ
jgi:hypothetical protein